MAGATTYTRDASGRITRILAPVPPGVLCPATGGLNPGCRGLRLVYGDGTAGSVAGQVKEVWLDIYDPQKAGGAGMSSVKVASYAYDATSKRLLSVTDPRSGLATGYAYDSMNRLTSFTSPGLKPINLGYTAGVDSKLSAVTRDRPAGDPAGGTATLASFVYGAPISGAGLADLSAGAVSVWGQAKGPVYAAAVFGPEHSAPSSNPANISAEDWQYADFQYTDAAGYTINSASFGAGEWQIDATTYDERGNVIATWDERATAMLRAAHAAGTPLDAGLYATTTVYNQDIRAGGVATGAVMTPAGMLVTDTLGPVREAVGPDGVVAQRRPHTATRYDQGAPSELNPATGAPWRLPTTETISAFDPATGVDQLVSLELSGYDPAGGAAATDPSSGWVLGSPTSSTTDMDLSGTVTAGDITRRTRFDAEGRTVATSQPSSDGADAGTRLTAFYSAAQQSAPNAACGGKPQWAGLVCRVYPGGQPSSGSPLLDETTTGFTYLLAPTAVVESAGDVLRTTSLTYLADGRPLGSRVSVVGVAGSAPQKGTQTQYDPVTGLVVGVRQVDASGAPTAVGSVTEYDQWGRVISQRNELGDVTTTGFDAAG
ncbi:MAG: RHS repeat-associated core domain-containing protein, partial [Angustibacter sp.]